VRRFQLEHVLALIRIDLHQPLDMRLLGEQEHTGIEQLQPLFLAQVLEHAAKSSNPGHTAAVTWSATVPFAARSTLDP
jgi:hypothetical protein